MNRNKKKMEILFSGLNSLVFLLQMSFDRKPNVLFERIRKDEPNENDVAKFKYRLNLWNDEM